MLVVSLLTPQQRMLTAYTCSTPCLWLCYIEGEHPQHVLSIRTGISQSCHPCAREASAPIILCCTGPAAHTSRGGFTHRFACCSHCVCDNKPQPRQHSLLQTYYIPPGAAGWLKRAEMAKSVVGGWKERTQQLAGIMEPLVEWCEWPPSREQRRRGN